MLKLKRPVAALLGLAILTALGLTAAPARAQQYITSDTTINYAINSGVQIGLDSGGNVSSPTVRLENGGSISKSVGAYGNCTLDTYPGSSIGLTLDAGYNSTVYLYGGTINSGLIVSGTSTVTILGGTVQPFSGVNYSDSSTSTLTLVGSNQFNSLVRKSPGFSHGDG